MQRTVDHVFMWSYEDCTHVMQGVCFPDGNRTHLRRMKPAEVAVWAVVASDGSKTISVYIENDVRVNTRVCIQISA